MSLQLLVGGYTAGMGGGARGIGLLETDDADGALAFHGVVAEASSPSYLAEASGTIYAADEDGGRVEAFHREGEKLSALGGQPTSGTAPCQLTIAGRYLFVANYGNGNIDVFPLDDDGRIGSRVQSVLDTGSGPHPAQTGPHAHATLVLGQSVLTANLGNDTVGVHRSRNGLLIRTHSLPLPPGTGPRDFALTPDGRLWLLGELSGMLHELDIDGSAASAGIPVTSTPVAGDHGAALAQSADGRFLYTGLRGSDRIAVIDVQHGLPVGDVHCGGSWPRHMTVIGERLYVACERSDSVTVFDLHGASGVPQFAYSVAVPSPTFLLELRAS